METIENKKALGATEPKSAPSGGVETVQALFDLTGRQILERILEHENPQHLIAHVTSEDFYWLIKRIGEDDCTPLLKMASDDQKQHLLDLEFWEKDRVDLHKASAWLGRLHQADPESLIKWFHSRGESFAYFYLFKSIQVEIKSWDEDSEFDERFFTFDGVHYVKVLDQEQKETIKNILRTMAKENLERYQALLSTLAGVIPAELEEDIYRMRNVRLAEHGFLPTDEALAVYAPLTPEALNVEAHVESPTTPIDEKIRKMTPISPLYHSRGRNILTKTFSKIRDNLLLDRLRLEFAGLCNQILSADGVLANELDALIRTCRKAAGHLNLALERLCNTDISMAEKLLENNHLVPVFRVGFGLVLELKWETERWLKNSWFSWLGLGFGFWGDHWGETLAGIVKSKPRLYTHHGEDGDYKAFEHISELDDARRLIQRLKSLDRMMAQITEVYPLERDMIEDNQLTLRQLMFNLWARHLLKLEPGYSCISTDQIKAFFGHLRTGEEEPPYRMPGTSEVFIKDFMEYAPDVEPVLETSLKEALSLIWQEFSEEYEWVATADLEARYSKFI